MASFSRPLLLLSLPDDILNQTLSLLPSQRDLYATCLACRKLNALADPILHKNVLFEEPRHHAIFSESLTTRPRRGSLIENVRIEYPSSEISEYLLQDESGYPIDRFSHSISTMTNLTSLVVSVPDALSHGIGHVLNGPFDLACLQSCTLFYQCKNEEYWDLRANIHVFSHPNLEHLIIRRAKLDQEGFEFLEKPRATPLQTLQFIECDINIDALYDILVLPQSLKKITISQLRDPLPPLEESSDLMDDYMSAIKATKHSLESLVIDFPSLTAKNPLRLRTFDQLTCLELRDYQLFGQATPRLYSVGLPPNLKTLKFYNLIGEDEDITELLCLTIRNKSNLAPNWAKLIVECSNCPPDISRACEEYKNFLVEEVKIRERILSTDSVIIEILSSTREKFELNNSFEYQDDKILQHSENSHLVIPERSECGAKRQ